eukprot:TRINITY_DN131_c0_g1_i1.p1 TRINITY_DN131_c0_g1~~TRINITY_DN131_c0_g1_i1.p1  ORF type:complete len:156 (+),score=14.91 TRINITY_DN131_c0_g1_i1:88-555(+)
MAEGEGKHKLYVGLVAMSIVIYISCFFPFLIIIPLIYLLVVDKAPTDISEHDKFEVGRWSFIDFLLSIFLIISLVTHTIIYFSQIYFIYPIILIIISLIFIIFAIICAYFFYKTHKWARGEEDSSDSSSSNNNNNNNETPGEVTPEDSDEDSMDV